MEMQLLFSLAIIHALALASPGPDFALVVKLATQESREAALASAVGISLAILLHTLLSLTGVSFLIRSSPTLFVMVQLVGASYLGWMGLGAIRATWSHWRAPIRTMNSQNMHLGIEPMKGFLQGLYTNLLNPKALVFFITLFSTLITPQITMTTKVAATLLLPILSVLWFSLIAILLSRPSIQARMLTAAPVINLITGLVFIGVAGVIISGLSL